MIGRAASGDCGERRVKATRAAGRRPLGLEVSSEPTPSLYATNEFETRPLELLPPVRQRDAADARVAGQGKVAVASRPHVRCPERERGDLRR